MSRIGLAAGVWIAVFWWNWSLLTSWTVHGLFDTAGLIDTDSAFGPTQNKAQIPKHHLISKSVFYQLFNSLTARVMSVRSIAQGIYKKMAESYVDLTLDAEDWEEVNNLMRN